jgi:hypothetical protein
MSLPSDAVVHAPGEVMNASFFPIGDQLRPEMLRKPDWEWIGLRPVPSALTMNSSLRRGSTGATGSVRARSVLGAGSTVAVAAGVVTADGGSSRRSPQAQGRKITKAATRAAEIEAVLTMLSLRLRDEPAGILFQLIYW